MKPYYCYIKNTNISYLEITNNLAEYPTNKPANNEIPMRLDYLEPKKFYQPKWP